MKKKITKQYTFKSFDRELFLKWINDDKSREAKLVEEVPLSPATLIRLKNGTYDPSRLLTNMIYIVMERYP